MSALYTWLLESETNSISSVRAILWAWTSAHYIVIELEETEL